MYLRLVNILEKYWKNLVVDTNDISKLVTAEKSSKSCCEEEKIIRRKFLNKKRKTR